MGNGIVDADTHVNEPPDLWEKRFPKKLLDQAPRVVKSDAGWAWAFGEGRTAAITQLINTAGLSPVGWQVVPPNGYDNMRPGGWDPAARLADMDTDMVDVHCLYPSYAAFLSNGTVDNRDVHIAIVRAYNDWLSEFCSFAPERLYGLAMMPQTGVKDVLAELKRTVPLPGIRAVALMTWPNGGSFPKAEDDAVWSALADADVALIIHIGFGGVSGEATEHMEDLEALLRTATLPVINRERTAVDILPVVSDMLLSGILERHPTLRVGFIESGIGWVPFFLEQTEDNFRRHRFWTNTKLSLLPSEYWQRQCFATFQQDSYGIRNRDLVGVETIMWSSDYPHSGADWPNSRATIASQLRDVPPQEKDLITGGNARRLFGLPPR